VIAWDTIRVVTPALPAHAFPWTTFWTAVGSITPTVALAGGIALAFGYRHKANASVSAYVYWTASGLILEVRPSLGAVGPFRLKIKDSDDGAEITVTSQVVVDGTPADAASEPMKCRAFREDFVSQGETVSTSSIFAMREDAENLVGWFVTFDVTGRGFLRDGLSWQSRVFVPLPTRDTLGGDGEG
jgi:hypothetical protein